MAYPKYSLLLKVAISDGTVTTTSYTSKTTADAAYVTAVNSGDYNFVSLFLETLPSKGWELPTWEGTYVDSYGVERYIGTNEIVD